MFGGVHFFPLRLLKRTALDQPTVDNGGVSKRRSVAVAVGCWHFDGTSMALQQHFKGTLTALQRNFNSTLPAHPKLPNIYLFFFGVADVDIFFCIFNII